MIGFRKQKPVPYVAVRQSGDLVIISAYIWDNGPHVAKEFPSAFKKVCKALRS